MDEHKKAESLFSDFFDNELNGEELIWLEKHLESCEPCKNDWDKYKQAMEEVSGLMHIMAPENVVDKVESRINKRSRGKFFNKQKYFTVRYSIVSFILVLFFVLAYLLMMAVNEIVLFDSNDDNRNAVSDKNVEDSK
ncbi:MAG: zf-HC2 domain-containing protein [Deltaproteobacteria bacterium]|nr:zf-HC2 domain-containing protein [Deltaproteobacteria bacterium]